jgi:hypothetical protein
MMAARTFFAGSVVVGSVLANACGTGWHIRGRLRCSNLRHEEGPGERYQNNSSLYLHFIFLSVRER